MELKEGAKLDRQRKDLLYKAGDLNEMAEFLEKTNFVNADLAVKILKTEAKLLSDKADFILKDLLNPSTLSGGGINRTMGTLNQSKQFSCFNDCRMQGCPKHIMAISIQTTSDILTVNIDGKPFFSADPEEWKTLMELVKRCDYNFFEVK